MKERIRELANGQVEITTPALAINPVQIEERLPLDITYKASIHVDSTNGIALKGVVYSSHSRVIVAHPTFYGRSCDIFYEVNTNTLSAQAVIEGGFTLVTNAGVIKIPFAFSMEEPVYGSEGRVIRSVYDFADFTAKEPEAAYRFFRSKAFMDSNILKNPDQIALYQTLVSDRNVERGVEEFLSGIGAKPSLVFTMEGDAVKNYSELTEDVGGEIVLQKNTWGYGDLVVSCSSDFIELSTDHITSHDFVEDTYVFRYTIKADLLAQGLNVADILFTTAKGDKTFRISITQQELTRFASRSDILRKRSSISLMQDFVAYRIAVSLNAVAEQKRRLKSLYTALKKLREETEDISDRCGYGLMLIYVDMLRKHPEEADLLLDEVREPIMQNRLVNNRHYCFYLYLRALFTQEKEHMETASALINKYYAENGQDPVLMMLLMEVDSSLKENSSLALLRLKELYKNGCRSPLLYLLAVEHYRSQPDLLRVLNSFELQVVYFGARKGLLSEEMSVEVARAAAHEQQYKPFTRRLLVFLCKKYPTDAMLEMLLGYLIRSGYRSERDFPWYEMGVERHLAITSLNEVYMYCLPADYKKPIPKEVLLFFTYSNNMKDDLQEKLYENVLMFYPQDSPVYREYRPMMEEYALTKLLEGRISRKLVPLYRHLIVQEMIDERLAKVLPNLLMAYEFSCSNPKMQSMVLRYPELNYEDTLPLENGICCAPLFMDNCMIFFIDAFGHRYLDVPYTKELLFEDRQLMETCEKVYPGHFMFRLRRTKEVLAKEEPTQEEVDLLREMYHVAELNPQFRLRIVSKLLDVALAGGNIEKEVLEQLDLSTLSYQDRRKALECLVKVGNYDAVYSYIKVSGINGLAPESLLTVLSSVIKSAGAAGDEHLGYLCLYLFSKNVYNSTTLVYLLTYYDGPSDMMCRVMFEANRQKIPCGEMAERILAQKLFSGDWDQLDDVYDIYRRQMKVTEMLERAYYVVCSYRYFVLEKPMEERIFAVMEDYCMLKDSPYVDLDLCNIALLCYYSSVEHLTREQLSYCEAILDRLCKKGLMFGFYGRLWTKVSCPAELNGKFLLEHRTKNARRVYLHGTMSGSSHEDVVAMKEMYHGIFVTQVVLFADETMNYSIVEERDGADGPTSVVVKKEVLANDMSFVRQGSVFDTINQIGTLYAQGQDKRLEEALLAFEAKNELINKYFDVM